MANRNLESWLASLAKKMPKKGTRISLIVCILAGCVAGCQPTGTTSSPNDPPASAQRAARERPIAFVNSVPVTVNDLRVGLIEAAGGEVLAEVVLDRRVGQDLAQQGVTLGEAALAAERRVLSQSLSDDPNTAARLLRELRQRRGDNRFEQRLRISAGLRHLVQPEVQVSDGAVEQAYRMRYGVRYEARLIVVPTSGQAQEMLRQARGGASFSDLAVRHSTDVSRNQGGLLPPISPYDATFPAGIRSMLQRMQPGQVSDPVALENGVAVLRLERILPAQNVTLAQVEGDLRQRVRRGVEQVLMQRRARTYLSGTDVTVLDPSLAQAWSWQRERLLTPEGER